MDLMDISMRYNLRIVIISVLTADKLYAECTLSLPESRKLVNAMMMKHHLPENVLSDMLRLIKCHLPPGVDFPITRQAFRSNFREYTPQLTCKIEHFCSLCKTLHDTSCRCDNPPSRKQRSVFVSMDIEEQIRRIISSKY